MENEMSAREYLRNTIKNPVKVFKEITRWSNEEYVEYNDLLKELKIVNRKNSNSTTAEKGKILEDIVSYIVEKTFILTVYRNKRTPTNEIDQIVSINDFGVQAMDQYNISTELIGFKNGYFIGECKDYGNSVGSTWVGKFYSLLKVSGNCELGIIFSYNGLSGEEDKWYYAHGLTKIIYRIEPDDKKIFIIDFNKKDFDRIASGESFFDIIKAKKITLQTNTKVENILEKHYNEEFVKDSISELFE